MKARVTFGCSDHKMVEFRILRGRKNAKSRTRALVFRREYFNCFRNLLRRKVQLGAGDPKEQYIAAPSFWDKVI